MASFFLRKLASQGARLPLYCLYSLFSRRLLSMTPLKQGLEWCIRWLFGSALALFKATLPNLSRSRKSQMRTHAQAVVIGGGLIGCSILYHLAKAGWTESVLLERDELTSGSTWHAAAGIHGLHDSTNTSRIQHYTIALYKELEKETGQSCGIFQP